MRPVTSVLSEVHQGNQSRTAAAALPLEWTVHLAAEAPRQTLMLGVIIAAVAVVSSLILGSAVWGLLAILLLGGATAEFLLPLHYTITSQGVRLRRLGVDREMRWEEIERMEITDRGVFLTPYKAPTRLEAFRGLFVWISAANEVRRELIIATLQKRIGEKV